jgi:hypothetical protein
MPASASIKLAIEAALRAANEGFQSMEGSEPVFDQTMTAAIASKHISWLCVASKPPCDQEKVCWPVCARTTRVQDTAP